MDIRKIRKLIELLVETGIAEIEIKEGEESIRLSRRNQALEPATPPPVNIPEVLVPSAASVSAPLLEKKLPEPEQCAGHTLCSPMVGTIYTAPAPEAPVFVTVGQSVKIGDTLCVIEAMKMFNEIEADRAGKITAILVKNGEPVEYNQPLFIIE